MPHENQQQESWQYQTGDTRMSYHSSSFSSSSHPSFGPPPGMPSLPAPAFHNMHQQMHIAAMQHHQSAMQHFDNVRQSMLGMGQPMQPMSGQMLLPSADRLAITEVEDSDTSSEEENSDGEPEWRPRNMQMPRAQANMQAALDRGMEDRHQAHKQELEDQRRAMEQRYLADQQSIQRQGAMMDERLAKLEAKETRSRAEHEAKDAELRQLREENNRLAQQRMLEAEKHRSEMADLARTQSFDTSSLEKVILEVQAQQLSKSDIEQVIQERVASQLQGLAKKKDIEAAGSEMQNALKQMPPGASIVHIQQTIDQELGKAVDTLSTKMGKQRAIEPANAWTQSAGMQVPSAAVTKPERYWEAPIANQYKQAVPIIEEAPSIAPSRMSKSKKVKPLPKMIAGPGAGPSTLSDDFPDTASKVSSWHRSRSSKPPSIEGAPGSGSKSIVMALPNIPEQPMSADSGTRVSKRSKSKISQGDNQDSRVSKSIMRMPAIAEGPSNTGDTSSSMSKRSKAAMPLIRTGDTALVAGLPADFPDTASKISSWERQRGKKSASIQPIIEEAPTVVNAARPWRRALPAIEEAPVMGFSARGIEPSAAMVRASVPPALHIMSLPPGQPLVPQSLPEDIPDRASQISSWQRGRSITPAQGTGQDLARIKKSSK